MAFGDASNWMSKDKSLRLSCILTSNAFRAMRGMEWQEIFIMLYKICFDFEGGRKNVDVHSHTRFDENTNPIILADFASLSIGVYLQANYAPRRNCDNTQISYPANISLLRIDTDESIHTLYEAHSFNEHHLRIQDVDLL